MGHATSRRSFLSKIGLGSLAAFAVQRGGETASAEAPDAKILGDSGVQTAARPRERGSPFPIKRSASASPDMASASSARRSASRIIPTSPWRR